MTSEAKFELAEKFLGEDLYEKLLDDDDFINTLLRCESEGEIEGLTLNY